MKMETALTLLGIVIDWFRSFTLSDLKFFIVLGVAVWVPSYFRKLNDLREKGLAEEFARNESFPPPAADQLKWACPAHQRGYLAALFASWVSDRASDSFGRDRVCKTLNRAEARMPSRSTSRVYSATGAPSPF
jgi:hypothetical protein